MNILFFIIFNIFTLFLQDFKIYIDQIFSFSSRMLLTNWNLRYFIMYLHLHSIKLFYNYCIKIT